MNSFAYYAPRRLEEAVRLLVKHGDDAEALAGGTDTLLRMKTGLTSPKYLVNLKAVRGLDVIQYGGDEGLRIGALSTLSAVEGSPLVREKYPALAQAAESIASPQIRNIATVGGNLCQEVWCWYLRGNYDCWLNKGRYCYAAEPKADNRWYYSIMGGNLCFAAHPSDLAVALAALNARVSVLGPEGRRNLSIQELLPGPVKVEGRMQLHSLQKGELVEEVVAPAPPRASRSVYVKYRLRDSWDFAIASAAVTVTLSNGAVEDCRIVLGGIATQPYRAEGGEELLRGKQISPELIEEVGEAAVSKARPLHMNSYKVRVAKAAVKRALQKTLSNR